MHPLMAHTSPLLHTHIHILWAYATTKHIYTYTSPRLECTHAHTRIRTHMRTHMYVQPYELLAAQHLDMDIERYLTVSA